MGIFRSSTRLGAVETSLAKVEIEHRAMLEKLVDRIAALEKGEEGLDSRLRLIKVEWESVLDKVNAVMGRLNARIRKSEAHIEPESDTEPPPQALPSPGSHSVLAHMRSKRGLLPR